MNEYRVRFSYIGMDSKRRTEADTIYALTSYEAVALVEEAYDDLNDLRIEEAWLI